MSLSHQRACSLGQEANGKQENKYPLITNREKCYKENKEGTMRDRNGRSGHTSGAEVRAGLPEEVTFELRCGGGEGATL